MSEPSGPPQQEPPYPPYGQQYSQYGPAYGSGLQTPPTNSLAIGSLVLSCIGLVTACLYGVGVLPGLAGAILGHVARGQVRRTGEAGGGLALAGVIVGWVSVAMVLFVVLLLVGLIVALGVSSDWLFY